MKVVFMGTPDFSVGALEALVKAGHEVTAVVTQPDRQKGRSLEMSFSPVKECALRYELPVFQPEKIKTAEAVEVLRGYEADIFVVAAFGQILSKEILEMPKYGCINIHASLLPKYRGAAPIQWAILNGDAITGVTIMQMNEGLDTGDILTTKEVEISAEETGESLFDKLAIAGAELLIETLPEIEKGTLTPIKQEEEKASHVRMLTKEMGKIDWEKEAIVLERLVRGMNSWPSAYCRLRNKNMKVWRAAVLEEDTAARPGEIVNVTKDALYIQTGKGQLVLQEVQLESKKRMPVKDFLIGYQLEAGEILG
ncbi:MAG: methionyl-tRNA formyltransferase [Lachnospiraceae bacterium]|nr:methionyl-tRNA formyltransferase [Lachnospiraceae bacterium]